MILEGIVGAFGGLAYQIVTATIATVIKPQKTDAGWSVQNSFIGGFGKSSKDKAYHEYRKKLVERLGIEKAPP